MSRWPGAQGVGVLVLVLVACGGAPGEEGPCTLPTCGAVPTCAPCGGGGGGGSPGGHDAGRAMVSAGPDASSPVPMLDGGVDAGVLDAGAPDAGRADGGAPDAGIDAGLCGSSTVAPPNLAADGDFECGAAPPFQSSGGGGQVDFVPGRSGRALRFTVVPGLLNNEFVSTWRLQVRRGGVYCARAFVRGTASAVSLRFYLGPPGSAVGQMFDMPGPWGSWSRLPPTLAAVQVNAQVGDEGLLVFSDTSHTTGATIEVDDVDVWRSDDGSCRER
ncbi:MAG: hypothetical protein JNJ54_15165 [Myxococcaceae bacterium]|nr:hypothetical protein [Myxococcaceae bacterium]